MTDTDVAGSPGGRDMQATGSPLGPVESSAVAVADARREDPAEPGLRAEREIAAEPGDLPLDDAAAHPVTDARSAEDLSDRPDGEGEEDVDDEGDELDGDGSEDGIDAVAGAGARSGRRSGGASLRRLEEEGEVAADYLEELLDITDLDGDIDIDVENGRASVAVVAEAGGDRELRRLAGPRGEVLEALQELSRLAVQARTGERSRLMLDVAGFRAARRRLLEGIAARACDEVKQSGQPVRLDPMSAFERKVVHDVVAEAGLCSESDGEEPVRRVVVSPAGL